MPTVDELKELLGVEEDQDLGKLFGRKKGAVSAWRKNGIPASVELKARDMLIKKNRLNTAEPSHNVEKEKAELSPEDQENLGLLLKLSPKKKRELKAELYRLLAEQERDALKDE